MRPHYFLPLLFFLLATLSCSEEDIKPIDRGGGGPSQFEWEDAQVILPDGVSYSLQGHELNALAESTPIEANGNTKVPLVSLPIAAYSVTNTSDAPVLLGYSTSSTTEISPASTAKMILFTLYRIATYPEEVQKDFLEGFDKDPKMKEFVDNFVEHWKSNPTTLADRSYIPLVKAYHAQFDTKTEVPMKGARTTNDSRYYEAELEASEVDGYSLQLEEPKYFHILNKGPGTATAFIYKTAVKRSNQTEEQKLITSFKKSTRAEDSWFVKYGEYIPSTNFFGLEDDYRRFWIGSPQVSESTTGPHELLLAADEEKAYYTVRLVRAGIDLSLEDLTSEEEAAYFKHVHASLIMDYYLPFMGTYLGLSIGDFYALDPEEMVNKLDAAFHEAGWATFVSNHLRGGRLPELLDLFTEMFQSPQSDYGIKFHEAVFKALGKSIPSGLSESVKRAGNLSYFFSGESFWGTEGEINLYKDLHWYRYGLISWEATARAAVVRVSPRKATVSTLAPNNRVGLTATIVSDDFRDLDVTYRWRTEGTYGSLGTGAGITEVETAEGEVTYRVVRSNMNHEDATEKVIVDVLTEGQIVGSDTATILISRSQYRMEPRGITLKGDGEKGPNIASLRILPRDDDAAPLVENEEFDFRIDWQTEGKHGGLRWDGQFASYWTTETETVNDNGVQYRCTDDQTLEGQETIVATIYTKPKGTPESDYEFLDSVSEIINIDNDDKKKIIHVAFQHAYYNRLAEIAVQGGGYGTWLICSGHDYVSIPKDPDAVRYSMRFYNLSRNLPGRPSGASWTASGQNVRPFPANTNQTFPAVWLPLEREDSYYYAYSSGGGSVTVDDRSGTCARAQSPFITGMAEVTIYLK